MSRSPLDIVQVDQSFTIYARCDGEKIEQVVAHNEVLILKEITPLQALMKGRELIDYAMQMLAKAERDSTA